MGPMRWKCWCFGLRLSLSLWFYIISPSQTGLSFYHRRCLAKFMKFASTTSDEIAWKGGFIEVLGGVLSKMPEDSMLNYISIMPDDLLDALDSIVPQESWPLKDGYFEDPTPAIQVQALPLEGPRILRVEVILVLRCLSRPWWSWSLHHDHVMPASLNITRDAEILE